MNIEDNFPKLNEILSEEIQGYLFIIKADLEMNKFLFLE